VKKSSTPEFHLSWTVKIFTKELIFPITNVTGHRFIRDEWVLQRHVRNHPVGEKFACWYFGDESEERTRFNTYFLFQQFDELETKLDRCS
jgi:hypothetical protein